MMKAVPVDECIGMVLCHDITKIVPEKFKGRAFKKGHVVTKEDIEILLQIGKEHLYVLDLENTHLHENDAADRIAKAVAGPGIDFTEVCEGRVNMTAEYDGLLKINVDALEEINTEEGVVLSTIHTNQSVTKGRALAGTRVVPLIIEEERIRQVETICERVHASHGPVLEVKPYHPYKVGVVTTGSEIYHGRIKDAFGPIIKEKVEALGSSVLRQILVSDEQEMTVAAIRELIDEGADMIICTGGMSVDPDDQTPASIRAAGGDEVTYGSPTFPGAMFMLAYIGDIPVLGMPGCVMYHKASIFELTVPRILTGERLTRKDIVRMGHGGFCAGCGNCRYPICPFGKSA